MSTLECTFIQLLHVPEFDSFPYYIILQPACTLRNAYEYYHPPSYTSSVPAYQLLLSVVILYLLASIIYLESKKLIAKMGQKI